MKNLWTVYLLIMSALCYSLTGLGQSHTPKKVSILGDSYSTFEGYLTPDSNYNWYYKIPRQKNDVRKVSQTWWHLFIKGHQDVLETNNSFSGATICYTGYHKDDYSRESFVARMYNLGHPDIIFIFGATNDSWADSPIGDYQYSDWKTAQLYSFRPAMAYMLAHMVKQYPDTKIYFLLNDGLKDSINKSVIEICKHYNIDCIKLTGIDKQSGHPSIKGMAQINDQISAYIKKERTGHLAGNR
ncbi:GDSL-like Lipase/Acylhydrolase [Arachidicoccus rhizosphaerae]|uniref:GDSL-like Lipase/Acylhydrolase n=1 Tax=Arachidicoccus rhizosphaerae TaxID=551991 RepID=A0A1H3VPM9_9BACT|nr:SGNH/GDSL hydrolase family protein [Arachidicoccus rhizosphaerae]SDZ76736.1 GDSL-like Lipase/Acylhydrolase [Arachidicoccus rhizosphaerae]